MSKRGKDAGLAKRRKLARQRFRAIVRMVILNKSWLQDVEEHKISTNIKKNIAMLVRQQTKIGILTMAEKALIRSNPYVRTINDRKKLVLMMLNMTCFARFPPKIRARLSTVVKFIYVTPGRYIIREGSDPYAMYFILTGEIEVTRKVLHPKTNEYMEKLDFISGPGDSVGEIELLERTKRQQTCKATNDVELLTIYEEDFDAILRPFMEKQWHEKKVAMASFDYFKDWDNDQIVYVCKVGLLKQYNALETIYDEDIGPLSYVHFVISGRCMILQCLKMKVSVRKGVKSYSLVDIAEGEGALMFSELTKEELLKKLSESKAQPRAPQPTEDDESAHSSASEEEEEPEEEVAGVYRKARKSDYKRYAALCGVDLRTPAERKESIPIFEEAINRLSIAASPRPSERPSFLPGEGTTLRPSLPPSERRSYRPSDFQPSRMSELRSSVVLPPPKKEIPFHYEDHFIDVGSLTFGGIFGLGEQLEHRVIMARTTVQCLLIPRFWLLEKDQNPGNIWQRMRFYLNSTIPSREILFQDFLATRKWQSYKKELIEQTLDSTKIGNPTKLEDIPIICRVVEADDDEENS